MRAVGAARKVVGYAPGAWDLFHVGHLNVLRHAAARCDYLIAGVVDDAMLEAAKGRRPVVPALERAEIIRSVRFVDEVVVETQPDKLLTWREHPFDLFFKGDDWRGTPAGADLEQRFGEVGVEVVYFPYTMHTSSTQLRRALTLLDPAAARTSVAAE
ncbi:adenylyltransferase/cytidyltransferase family protein [Sanguibacter sp. A246]